MTKKELEKHIKLYKDTENAIFELDKQFGINIWDSAKPNFYNNFNLIIHNLLVNIFDDKKVELLEEYIFEQNNLSFDELCNKLNIKDETNTE